MIPKREIKWQDRILLSHLKFSEEEIATLNNYPEITARYVQVIRERMLDLRRMVDDHKRYQR